MNPPLALQPPARIQMKQSLQMTQSTSSDISTASTISDRQLHPRHQINYNKMLLKSLPGKPQVRTANNISIPLPATDTELEDSSEDRENRNTDLVKTDTI